eukprot:TRINITY_DN41632_c0_g1_i1.p1 TRINITY_DN41632_c0_g1~~TRINITY_DN41632_c0_g1_i1.p1  ORF type:complete len:534 (-),score=88.78 TRINITY_DN41632_c0_g1_i1:72-1631(-)
MVAAPTLPVASNNKAFVDFVLNAEAAERFLLSVSLSSVPEDVVEKGRRISERARPSSDCSDVAPYSVHTPKGASCAAARDLDRSTSPATLLTGGSLDVRRAKHFLLSLQVDSDDDFTPRRNSSRHLSWNNHLAKHSQRLAEKASLESESKAQQTVLIGGWRNGTDLDRIMPGLIKKGLLGGRIIVSSQQCSAYVCSTQPFLTESAAAANNKLEMMPMSSRRSGQSQTRASGWLPARWARRWTCMLAGRGEKDWAQVSGISYARFMLPTEDDSYDPHFLDDPGLRQGKHHTVLQLDSYQVSIIPFVRPRRLKEELNDQFRCSHPNIHPSITLSKLRNLQKDLRAIAELVEEVDLSTFAMAWVFFEKLVLADRVRKVNRKLLAGACLTLAFKFNQHGERSVLRRLASEIRKLDRKDQLNMDALHEAEVQVFIWLEFGLHLRQAAVLPHLYRTLKELGLSHDQYYGPNAAGGFSVGDGEADLYAAPTPAVNGGGADMHFFDLPLAPKEPAADRASLSTKIPI